ncbi:DUF1365 domain-containing protein [Piscinibacter sakaiensis]|uniref:DUF1365 domain-containing protein n=1 Tax=Piscinibacter sakaiensis TaxID=1547922 RepID=UPI003AADFBF1
MRNATARHAAEAQLGIGVVRHARLRPVAHRFAYPTYFLMLPMRSLAEQPAPALRRNRFGLLSFHDRDHGDGRADSLQWLTELLQHEGVSDADGEIWLHCYPRVLGLVFKPVSFWYCHRADGTLAAIVVEVNNTFGERHCYLLDGRSGAPIGYGRELQADKVFHVSPFCRIDGSYRFRFMRTDLAGAESQQRHGHRTVARIDHVDADGPLLLTSVSGELAPLSAARIRHAFFSVPWMTLGVIVHIHWQALRLWLKRIPFVRKPDLPANFVSR